MPIELTNQAITAHPFLKSMYDDGYFPKHLVDKGRTLLLSLCQKIEQQKPKDDASVYALTHATTEDFNALAVEFEENDSEIETAARDAIATDIEVILKAYGFAHLDLEEAIAPRDW